MTGEWKTQFLPSECASIEGTVAFQGKQGAYSELACRALFPDRETLACADFDAALAATSQGRTAFSIIPIENSIAGRVADIHHLLPETDLHIIAEHYQPVRHHLLALPGTRIEDLHEVRSHTHALAQCRRLLAELGVRVRVSADTAGAAQEVASLGDPSIAAIASAFAGELNKLESLRANIEDRAGNVTRFLVMSRQPLRPEPGPAPTITSLFFRLRSVPAALYKALGGFATNGVNLTRIESCLSGGGGAQFFIDLEGHPVAGQTLGALEELAFFCQDVRIVGVYLAHPARYGLRAMGR